MTRSIQQVYSRSGRSWRNSESCRSRPRMEVSRRALMVGRSVLLGARRKGRPIEPKNLYDDYRHAVSRRGDNAFAAHHLWMAGGDRRVEHSILGELAGRSCGRCPRILRLHAVQVVAHLSRRTARPRPCLWALEDLLSGAGKENAPHDSGLIRSVDRTGRCFVGELGDRIHDPAPDRRTIVIAVLRKFVGSPCALHLGVLAVTLEH
jgi:hypothetical protein